MCPFVCRARGTPLSESRILRTSILEQCKWSVCFSAIMTGLGFQNFSQVFIAFVIFTARVQQWPWEQTAQPFDFGECTDGGSQLLAFWNPQPHLQWSVLPTGCSQPMAECTRVIKAGPFLGDVSKMGTHDTKAWLGFHLEKYPRKQKWGSGNVKQKRRDTDTGMYDWGRQRQPCQTPPRTALWSETQPPYLPSLSPLLGVRPDVTLMVLSLSWLPLTFSYRYFS